MNSETQNGILNERCVAHLTPEDFIGRIYSGHKVLVSYGGTTRGGGSCRQVDPGEVLGAVEGHPAAYVYPATFLRPVPRTSLADELLAFVVDLDDVADGGLEFLLDDISRCSVKPCYICSSGSGYHLWYPLWRPIQLRKRWLDKLNAVNDALYEYWVEHAPGCVCDLASSSLPHGFRCVGSLDKNGSKVCECWQVSFDDTIDVHALADELGVKLEYADGSKVDFYRLDPVDSHGGRKLFNTGNAWNTRHEKLYEFTKREIEKKARKGHRFMSMFCLAGIAYNCGVEYERLEADLYGFVEKYWRGGPDPVRASEVPQALKGYCNDYAQIRRETREEWLGWRYAPPKKRNYGKKHKTRSEHAMKVNKARNRESDLSVADARNDNPDASKREIAEITGLSIRTVERHWASSERWM